MPVPIPTPMLRFIHVENLHVLLRRGAMHAPNFTPNDGLRYRTIHHLDVQAKRHTRVLRKGPGGTIHDYVAFYFGPLSPMMLQLKTGQVDGYTEGQEPLIYLVAHAQDVAAAGIPFVFSDGHGIAAFTRWFDDLDDLDKVDWSMVQQRYWKDTVNDSDRQRRKQAEFLVHRSFDWPLIREIAVIDTARKRQVENILDADRAAHRPTVTVWRDWYYR